jgi:hypothetical protein
MITLTVNQNQTDYIGLLEKPAFSLMGEGRQIIEGLYHAFSGYQVALTDFRLEEVVTTPSSFGVNVYLRSLGSYRCRFDRVEWTATNFVDGDLSKFPEILKLGEDWLRSAVPDISFKSHTFFYTGHCQLSEGTSQSFLLGLPCKDIIVMGQDLGGGIIHNWRDPGIGGRFQLLIDHSLSIKDGLFIQLMALIEGDRVDYSAITATGQASLKEALRKIGLQLETEQEIV